MPAALSEFRGKWVEYGVVEYAYAQRRPTDWRRLVDLYGHRAIEGSNYTVSAFLGATLGRLWRNEEVCFHEGPATGHWKYNVRISWWALAPEPDWDERLSWEDSGLTVDYVPGQHEVS